jgi:DNA-directed RNA polymerase subunit RPC12/RpoP
MAFDPGYEEDEPKGGEEDQGRRFTDFDCPDCSANNPYDDSFGNGDEVRCYYCGQEFRADVSDSGRLKLRAV